jgi:hypothetical protein
MAIREYLCCIRRILDLLDVRNETWANYGWDGTSLSMINSGTFTIGAPPVAGAVKGGKPSTQKQ